MFCTFSASVRHVHSSNFTTIHPYEKPTPINSLFCSLNFIPVSFQMPVPAFSHPLYHNCNQQEMCVVPHLHPQVLSQNLFLLKILCLDQVWFKSRVQQIFSVISRTLHPEVESAGGFHFSHCLTTSFTHSYSVISKSLWDKSYSNIIPRSFKTQSIPSN